MSHERDDVWLACDEVVRQLEQERCLAASDHTDPERFKLVKRMREYFKKALKDFNFNQDFEACVNEYAECAIGAVFCGLGDRQWIEHADFLMVLHFAVRDHFPKSLHQKLDGEAFEEVIFQAYDRAFDEQRWIHGRWGLIKETVSGKQSLKKVHEAIDEARKHAAQSHFAEYFNGNYERTMKNTTDFLFAWISEAIKQLNIACYGDPDSTLSKEQAGDLFAKAVNSAGIPPFMKETSQPVSASMIKSIVNDAYANYGTSSPFTRQRDGDWALQYDVPRGKPQKNKGKGKHRRSKRSRTPPVRRTRSGDSPTPPRRSPGRDSSGSATPPREWVKRELSPPPVRPGFLWHQSDTSGYASVAHALPQVKEEPAGDGWGCDRTSPAGHGAAWWQP